MKIWHLLLILVVGYALGVFFPAVGNSVVNQAKSITGA